MFTFGDLKNDMHLKVKALSDDILEELKEKLNSRRANFTYYELWQSIENGFRSSF